MKWWYTQQLASKHVATRLAALQKLAAQAGPETFELFISALRDSAPEVRRVAAQTLALSHPEQAYEPLLQAVLDDDSAVRHCACVALREYRDTRSLAALVYLLRDSDLRIRQSAAETLEALGWEPRKPEETILAAIAWGQFDKAAACGALAIPDLAAASRVGTYARRAAAIEALGRIDDEQVLPLLLQALTAEDAAVKVAAIQSSARFLKADLLDAFLGVLHDEDAHVRFAAVEILGESGLSAASGPLLEAIQDTVWEVRAAAIHGLRRLNHVSAVPALIPLLQDSENNVREITAMTLGQFCDPRAIEGLVGALVDSDPNVSQAAARALEFAHPHWPGTAAAQQAVPRLRAALSHAEYSIRQAAAEALARIGQSSGPTVPVEIPASVPPPPAGVARSPVPILLDLLRDPDRDLRQAAAEALGRLADRSALLGLAAAVNDSDEGVRRAVAIALSAMRVAPKTMSPIPTAQLFPSNQAACA